MTKFEKGHTVQSLVKWNIFRQINYLVISLVKVLEWFHESFVEIAEFHYYTAYTQFFHEFSVKLTFY